MKIVRTSIALIALASASGFAAADVQNLQVKAQVTGVCKFGTIPALDFGIINPSTITADVPGSSKVPYQCTKSTTAPTLTVAATPRAMSDGTNSLAFTLSAVAPLTPGTGFSSSASATDFTISGTIALAAAQDAVASTGYTTNVSLTIAP